MAARDHVPSAAAGFHGVVDRRAAFALDHVAVSIGDPEDQRDGG
jgi:hypothetical protein